MSRLRVEAAQQLAELAARLAEGQRLSRGRRYQRQGHVVDLTVDTGYLTASVVGSRPEPYEVTIACKAANENERNAAASDMGAAVPRPIDVAFTCICPDWGDPCKHGVAVLLSFADAVEADAGLLLEWRGLDDLIAPPPPGTESLEIHAPGTPAPTPRPDTARRPGTAAAPGTDAEAADRAGSDGEDAPGPPDALEDFFWGAMPTEQEDLVGPLDHVQLDAYAHARIVVEDVDGARVIADAVDAIADHWLSR